MTETVTRTGRASLLWALVVVVVVAVAAFIMLPRPPERVEEEVLPPEVRVRRFVAGDVPVVVRGHGAVRPKVSMEIAPEVAGRVVFVHSQFRAGGVIRANEKIVQVDPREYELAVRQARAAVAEAQAGLDTEIAEAEVERREWGQPDGQAGADPLRMLREPRIRRARAALESAEAQLSVTELRLERTTISLPFDAIIAGQAVDLGQYVVAGQPLATARGIDAFEVEVLLPSDDVAWLDLLSLSDALAGRSDESRVAADVRADFGGGTHIWAGYITRMMGQVDTASRMVPVVVEVPRPLEVSAGRPPLLPGTVVEVLIAGKTLNHAMAVPLDAVVGGDRIWLVEDGRLTIRPVEIVRTDQRHAYVVSGVSDGALVVTGAFDGLAEGMAVRALADSGDG